MSTAHQIPRWECVVIVVVFLCAILMPLVRQATDKKGNAEAVEKRKLAEFPELQEVKWEKKKSRKAFVKYINKFPAKFEAYYNDHFGWRSELLATGAWVKVRGFGESSSKDVIVGRDGWLFYAAENSLSDLLGNKKLSKAELLAWRSWLEFRHDWLARRGVRYLFVIAPNKESIYPEFIPSRFSRRHGTGVTDQLLNYLKDTGCAVSVLDLRPALIEVKSTMQAYFKTDTHWTDQGAFVGCQQIIAFLQRWMPELKTESAEGVFSQPAQHKLSDLSAMLGLSVGTTESAPAYSPLQLGEQRIVRFTLPNVSETKERSPRTVIPGNPLSSRRALLLRDSFSDAMLKPLSRHFASTTWIWRSATEAVELEKQLAAILQQEKPDVFIEQLVERHVQNVPVPAGCFGGLP